MSKARVLFFSADPFSADGSALPLRLDDDVRQIQEKIRMAEHRDALEFDPRWAVRTDDLIQALNETRPQIVHFSGHGGSEGLVLMSADGKRPHYVDAGSLAELFEVFRGDIKVVVLNACLSLPQAEAIAGVVGCAIGTRGAISDEAAITFGAAFYRAIAFGRSVGEAFDQARVALKLEHFEDRECPELVARPGVDPAQLFVVHPAGAEERVPVPAISPAPDDISIKISPPPGARWMVVVVAATALSSGAVFAHDTWARSRKQGETWADCAPPAAARPFAALAPVATATTVAGVPSGPAADLAVARALYQAGNHEAAFPLFRRAARAGNAEAMGYLGTMYLYGQGTPRDPDTGMSWLRDAAGRRDARAMKELAASYQNDGVSGNDRWIRHWYQTAAEEKQDPEAMRSLGVLYRSGLHVARSDQQALYWFRNAARAGSADALVDIGSLYETGSGTPLSPRHARRCYLAAADAGAPRGLFALGLMYEKGAGVKQDYAAAAEWYRKGADAGSADAMNGLGVLYLAGRGVQRDSAAAVRLFQQAVRAGSTAAADNLGGSGPADPPLPRTPGLRRRHPSP